ncbi:MAG: DUF3368 domain-containing protein [Dehalococcoidia bacterium]
MADAGPLIALSWIDRLDLLGLLFDEVLVPAGVQAEVLRPGDHIPGVTALRAAFGTGGLQVRAVRCGAPLMELRARLDRGEAEALALLLRERVGLLLSDDRLARREAVRRGVSVVGTVGLLRQARVLNLIPAAYPTLLDLRRYGFWVSDLLLEQIRVEEAGPVP